MTNIFSVTVIQLGVKLQKPDWVYKGLPKSKTKTSNVFLKIKAFVKVQKLEKSF